MVLRMLVTADDSRESIAAATTAAHLAVTLQAQIRIFVVVEDDRVGEELERATGTDSSSRRRQEVRICWSIRRKVRDEGVPSSQIEVVQTAGSPTARFSKKRGLGRPT